MTTVKLAKKDWLLPEPVFCELKQILLAYNALSACTDSGEQLHHLKTLLRLFLGKKAPSVWRISSDEWTAFLTAIPTACGLEVTARTGNSKPSTDWGYLYAHLCASMGWDYDYVDKHMTLSRLTELNDYWLAHPPTHLLVAAYLGYEKKEQDSVQAFFAKCRRIALGGRR